MNYGFLKYLFRRIFGKKGTIKFAEYLVVCGRKEQEKLNVIKAEFYFKEAFATFRKLNAYNNPYYFESLLRLSGLMFDSDNIIESEEYALIAERLVNTNDNREIVYSNEVNRLLAIINYSKGMFIEGDKYFNLLNNNDTISIEYWNLFFVRAMSLLDRDRNSDAYKILLELVALMKNQYHSTDFFYLVYVVFATSAIKHNRLLISQIEEHILTEARNKYKTINTPIAHTIYSFLARYLFVKGDIPGCNEIIEHIIQQESNARINHTALQNILLMYGRLNEYSENLESALLGYKEALKIFIQVFTKYFVGMKQNDKYVYLNNMFISINMAYEFLIKYHTVFPEFILDVLNYRIKTKNYLYTDYEIGIAKNSGHESIINKLAPDEALVEIVRIVSNDNSEKIYYLFFILTSDANEKPIFFVYENGKDLEQNIYHHLIKNIQNKAIDLISYKKFWRDLDFVLENKKRIFFSPDGIFRIINPEAFYQDYDKTVFDEKEFIFINSAEMILNKQYEIEINSATLLGNPLISESENNDILKKIELNSIPETEIEITNTSSLLNNGGIDTKVFLDASATKANVLDNLDDNIFHLATHGIQFSNAYDEKIDMLYSNNGLLLSHSISFYNSDIVYQNEGILTGDEVQKIKLHNSSLVVLSSCNSGFGSMDKLGEMIGFPLAFLTAGSRFVLVSFWKVDDKTTRELFEFFYKYLLVNKNPILSLRIAKAKIKDSYKHPYYWAGFQIISR